MGDLLAKFASDKLVKTQFIRHLLSDVKCLDLMLDQNLIDEMTNHDNNQYASGENIRIGNL